MFSSLHPAVGTSRLWDVIPLAPLCCLRLQGLEKVEEFQPLCSESCQHHGCCCNTNSFITEIISKPWWNSEILAPRPHHVFFSFLSTLEKCCDSDGWK